MATSRLFNFLDVEDYSVSITPIEEIIEFFIEEIVKVNQDTKVFVPVNKSTNPDLFLKFLDNINIIKNNPFYSIIPKEISSSFNNFIVGAIVTSQETKEIVTKEMIDSTIYKLLNSNFEGIEFIENCEDGTIQVFNDGHMYTVILLDVRIIHEGFFSTKYAKDLKYKIIIDCGNTVFAEILEYLNADKKLDSMEKKISLSSHMFYQAFCMLTFKNNKDRNMCIDYLSRYSDTPKDKIEKAIVYH